MTRSPAPAPKKGLPAAERRQTLLDAAWDLLAEGGPKLVTIDSVVQRLGISRPIFYRHFRDRAALLVALYDRYAEELVGHQEAFLLVDEGPIDELLALSVTDYLDLVGAKGVLVRPLIEAAGDDPRMEAARGRLRERLFVLWQHAIMRRLSPELQAVALADEEVRVALGLSLELVQALSNDAATIWLSGRATRPQVQHALLVMLGGLTQRFLDDLVSRGHLDPDLIEPGLL